MLVYKKLGAMIPNAIASDRVEANSYRVLLRRCFNRSSFHGEIDPWRLWPSAGEEEEEKGVAMT